MSRWAAILAGGSGTRFWPVSTPEYPKQFQSLAGEKPLLVDAVERLEGLVEPERTLIVTGNAFTTRTRDLLPGIPASNVLGEPRAASTAAALTWATHEVSKRDDRPTLLACHADWYVGDNAAFRACAETAMTAAERHDSLVTVGITPTRPDPGYGYILPGEELGDEARRVERFVEKPKRQVAARLISEGALWNCGMFAWTATRFFDETTVHAPEIAPHLPHLEGGQVDIFFERVTPIAIDKSHMERSDRVAVVPGTFPWDDVGNWSALSRVLTADADGNVSTGELAAIEAEDCVVWPGTDRLVLYGVRELVVARANGITLVTTKERATDLKELLGKLPPEWRAP